MPKTQILLSSETSGRGSLEKSSSR